MKTKYYLLFVILVLASCSRKKENVDNDIEEVKTISVEKEEAASAQMLSLTDSIDLLIAKLSANSNANEKDSRLSIALIDSAIASYDKGSIIKDSIYGINNCIGEDEKQVEYQNGLIINGAADDIFFQTWYFIGLKSNFMDLSPGLNMTDIKTKLGVPYKEKDNFIEYRSENDSSYFEPQWNIKFIFQDSILKYLRLDPLAQSC